MHRVWANLQNCKTLQSKGEEVRMDTDIGGTACSTMQVKGLARMVGFCLYFYYIGMGDGYWGSIWESPMCKRSIEPLVSYPSRAAACCPCIHFFQFQSDDCESFPGGCIEKGCQEHFGAVLQDPCKHIELQFFPCCQACPAPMSGLFWEMGNHDLRSVSMILIFEFSIYFKSE